ncbi:nuclear transport factor 2 family protein [Paracoccus alkanivorans]|uniref:DUF4440 domain-containing protein n=1 Tax=Paracoccus alkanivorans TaxID=2116655 RepID=A0A3M0MHN8_9RHOB|nr:nuclear transport factor 2 family protein [Paracoccus alkanivorans]RMC37262.1 DUF4440 domain-containing protein [Paracoccus alkanivorans]
MPEDVTTSRVREDALFEAAARPYLAEMRKALLRWAEVVSLGRLEDLLALYASDAILVPTMAHEIGGHADERRTYFESFLANPNLRCRIDTLRKRISHKLGTVVVGGHYTFTFECYGTEQAFPARYLFTFEEIDGSWLITGHHSSRMPSSS